MGHLTVELADRIAKTLLANTAREFPFRSGLVLRSGDDVVRPRVRHPVFFGCFDWHSAVHSHWSLARLLRLHPDRPWRARAERRFEDGFADEALANELATLRDNPGFELPYGLVWLLALATELDHDFHSEPWARALGSLEALAAERLRFWVRGLAYPIRSGQHSQSAFAMTMLLRWAGARGARDVAKLVSHRAIELHGEERGVPIGYEPSGYDFLSPALAVAELMTEVLPERDFARWLRCYLPAGAAIPEPVTAVDRSDGKLAHFDGLNLSRAWMLRKIAGRLPEDDVRHSKLLAAANAHGRKGLGALESKEYAVTHWVPTFAVYWLTGQ